MINIKDNMIHDKKLLELYYDRIDLYNNKYNYDAKTLRNKINNIEFKMLELHDGYSLLVNLKKISKNRMTLEYEKLEYKDSIKIFLELLQALDKCENILKLRKNKLLDTKEFLYIICIYFHNNLNKIKENIMTCKFIPTPLEIQ